MFRSIESIKKAIREHEWSIEKLEEARSREEVGQKRKSLLSFLTRQIKKKTKKKPRTKDRHLIQADRHASKADRHASKADRHVSKADRHASKADRHASKADRHASKADRHASKADRHKETKNRCNRRAWINRKAFPAGIDNTCMRDFWWQHREVSAAHSCMCMAHEASSSQHWNEKDIKDRCVPMNDKETAEIVNTFHKKMESCLDSHVCGVCGVVGLEGKGLLVPIEKLMCHAVDKDSSECAWSAIEVRVTFISKKYIRILKKNKYGSKFCRTLKIHITDNIECKIVTCVLHRIRSEIEK